MVMQEIVTDGDQGVGLKGRAGRCGRPDTQSEACEEVDIWIKLNSIKIHPNEV